jgi:hypothetical protein
MPPLIFLGTSIPTVLALSALGFASEYRVWIAIVVGAVATAVVQKRLAARRADEP